MSDRQSDSSDKSAETIVAADRNSKTLVRNDDKEAEQAPDANDDESILRAEKPKPQSDQDAATVLTGSNGAPRSEHATILRGASSDSATVLRTHASEKPSSDDATILAPGLQEVTNDDATIINPAQNEDATMVADAPDTTYIASTPQHQTSKSNTEAGRLLKNRFVLEQKVGSGGMGDVYKALDLRLKEAEEKNPYLAIKLLNESFARHKDAFISLQREVTRTKSITHENIMAVYDFDKEGDTVFMCMEFLEGEPLDDYLKEHPGGVSEEDAWNIINGYSQGLIRAHGAGIVHSDFKPGNIFYTADHTAKVFDFGIARAVPRAGLMERDSEGEEGEKTVFDPGSLGALTPSYASYEMLTGQVPSMSDDVYAAALVAYELFSGKHPYNRTPADKALERGMEPEPIAFLKRRHWRALKKALELKSEDRTATMEEFVVGMFSEDPPYLTIAAVASVVLASVAFGAYNFFFQEEVNTDLVAKQQEYQLRNNELKADLESAEFTPAWEKDIKEGINRLISTDRDLVDDFGQEESDVRHPPGETLTDRKIAVLTTYMGEVQRIREAYEQNNQNDELATNLDRAAELLATAKQFYNYEPSLISAQQGSLNTAIRLRDIEREQVAAAQRAEDERIARELQVEQRRLEAKNKAEAADLAYTGGVTELQQILRCKGDVTDADLDRMSVVVKDMAAVDPSRYAEDHPNIVNSLRNCIARRIGVTNPDRATVVKGIAVAMFPAEASIANIRIQAKDPCQRRGLAGRGTRNRSWCVDQLTDGGKSPELVVIPAASQIAAFAMSRTEVKIGDYNLFCKNTGCEVLQGSNSLPATNISVEQARGYMSWLSEQSGRSYRLPSIQEWRHAAKTEQVTAIPDNINCTVKARGVVQGEKLLRSLSGSPNPWGLYHYIGNAQEWATDGEGLYALGGAHTDPKNECSIDSRVVHSGERDAITGFRLLREIKRT